MKNTGKPSEKEFQNIIASLGKRGYTHRFPDASDAFGRNKKLMNIARQPGDFFVVENGEVYLADVKSCSNSSSFPFSLISKTQMAASRMITAAGGKYYFMVHNLKTNTWYKIASDIIHNCSKRSLKWSELEPYKWNLADAINNGRS